MSVNWVMIMIGSVYTLRPRQNGRHFPEDIFKWIFLDENVWTSINISLKFVPRGPINNIPTLVQIMAWRRPGDKPLSETMMARLPTYICVTRSQWVNGLPPSHYLNQCWLTHLPLDKMADILADNIFNCIFLNENDRIPIQISLKYVPK